jgi:hypothetical protein
MDPPTPSPGILLRHLWLAAPVSAFYGHGMGPTWISDEHAEQTWAAGRVDYYEGRPIKLPISSTPITDMAKGDFDRNAGAGAFDRAYAAAQREVDGTAAPGAGATPASMSCPRDVDGVYRRFGGEMLPGTPGTTICATCGDYERSHAGYRNPA